LILLILENWNNKDLHLHVQTNATLFSTWHGKLQLNPYSFKFFFSFCSFLSGFIFNIKLYFMFQNIHERESCQKKKKKQEGNTVFSQGTCPSGYRLSSEVWQAREHQASLLGQAQSFNGFLLQGLFLISCYGFKLML
jgi:hypothetical protein